MPQSYGRFRTGMSYDVLKPFCGYDGLEIAAGARFTVTSLDFLPYPCAMTSVCVVVNSRRPSKPFSRPWPERPKPPKGSSMPPPAP